MHIHPHRPADVAPHQWARKGWRIWLCRHCHQPRTAHPTRQPVPARDAHDNRRQP
jgi:ribosomal protein L37AE/L43A